LFVEDFLHGQGDDGFAAAAEEGVYFGKGVAGIIEGDEETLGPFLAGLAPELFYRCGWS